MTGTAAPRCNVDADVLAAALSNALGADHLRLVTGTAGLLTDPSDPASTLPHAYQGEAARYAGGRMRQKVRAAEMALEGGSADIAITGPHTLADPAGWTRFWRGTAPEADLELLGRTVGVPSVSGDEHELAAYLADWCRRTRDRRRDRRRREPGGDPGHRGPLRCCCSATWTRCRTTGPPSGARANCPAGARVDAKGSLAAS